MIGTRNKIVFVHIPKTGGSSVAWALRKEFDRPNPLQRMLKSLDGRTINRGIYQKSRFQPLPDHAKAIDYLERLGPVYWTMRSVAFVRNPFDLLISLYSYIQQTEIHHDHQAVKGISFKEFILTRCGGELSPYRQTSFLLDEQNRCLVSYVGRMENLGTNFQSFCAKVDVQASLSHQNKSNRSRVVADHYNSEMIDIVVETFRADFNLLGYSTDPNNQSINQMELLKHPKLKPI